MAELSLCSNFVTPSRPAVHHHCYLKQLNVQPTRLKTCVTVSAAKSGGLSINPFAKKCEKCTGQGAIECPGCKGTGRNKKNGNIFERWKCFECQGFGMKTCPECGKGEGLTPEQRGERY